MSDQLAQTDAADAAELAHYRYEQVLNRQTGKFASFAVAFAFVSIATGIFTTYGSTLITSGPLGIWTWPIVTVAQLAVTLAIANPAALAKSSTPIPDVIQHVLGSAVSSLLLVLVVLAIFACGL